MSLDKCLAKLGKLIDKKDQDKVRDLVKTMTDQGATQSQAEFMAVAKILEGIESNMDGIAFQVGRDGGNVKTLDPDVMEQPAYHGTKYKFDKFSLQAIGSGEGNQAYGWGLYFASRRGVAEWYRDTLAGKSLGRSEVATIDGGFLKDLYWGTEFTVADNGFTGADLFGIVKRLDDLFDKTTYVVENADETMVELVAYVYDQFDPVQVLDALKTGNWDGVINSLSNDIIDPFLQGNFSKWYATLQYLEGKQVSEDRSGQPEGQLYKVDVPDNNELLDYDIPVSEQTKEIKEALHNAVEVIGIADRFNIVREGDDYTWRGKKLKAGDLLRELGAIYGKPQLANLLSEFGLKGLRYRDYTRSRGGDGTFNFVIWDEDAVSIEEVNDQQFQADQYNSIEQSYDQMLEVDQYDPESYQANKDYKPRETRKVYKLFRIDPNRPGELFPLYVDADTPVPIGKWIDAKSGDQNAKGKVKSKIGDLAYRPGWHSGSTPLATHIGGFSDEQKATKARIEKERNVEHGKAGLLQDNGKLIPQKKMTPEQRKLKNKINKSIPYPPGTTEPSFREPFHVWAEVEVPVDVDWQTEADSRGTNARDQHIQDQIPFGGSYEYKTNSNMTGEWVISGQIKVNRILSDAEAYAVNEARGFEDLPRRGERLDANWDWNTTSDPKTFDQPALSGHALNGNLDMIEPAGRQAVQNQLEKMHVDDRDRLVKNLEIHSGTPWANASIKGLIVREMFDRALRGESTADLENLQTWGKFTFENKKMLKAFKGGEETARLFAQVYNFIGNNRKAERDISTSYLNCNPSPDCARFCYATGGTGGSPTAIMRGEFTEWAIENYPELMAERVANEYADSIPSEAGLALRINDLGDLSEAQVSFIKALNKRGIRMQVFSKRPELLRQLPDFNLKMLSVDESNIELAYANPDLRLAVVLTDGFTEEMVNTVKDRVAVYLPVNLKGKHTDPDSVRAMYPNVFKEMKNRLCPVDGSGVQTKSGYSYVQIERDAKRRKEISSRIRDLQKKKKLNQEEKQTLLALQGELDVMKQSKFWTCTACDRYGTHGCFHGNDQTAQAKKAVELESQTEEGKRKQAERIQREIKQKLKQLQELGGIDEAGMADILSELAEGSDRVWRDDTEKTERQDPGQIPVKTYFQEGEGGTIGSPPYEEGSSVTLLKPSELALVEQYDLDQKEDRKAWAKLVDAPDRLPESHGRYFEFPEGVITVPLNSIVEEERSQDSLDNAVRFMAGAYDRIMDKREPVTVRVNDDGLYEIVDGGTTTAIARQMGWSSLPVKVVSNNDSMTASKGKPIYGWRLADADFDKAFEAFTETHLYMSLDEIYEVAQKNQDYLGEKMAQVSKKLGLEFKHPGIKEYETAREKVSRKNYDLEGEVQDVVRTTILVNTMEDADKFIKEMSNHVDIFDEGYAMTPVGFFDKKLTVRFKDGTVGEIAVRLPDFFNTSIEVGHKYYEEWRVLEGKVKQDVRDQVEIDGVVITDRKLHPDYFALQKLATIQMELYFSRAVKMDAEWRMLYESLVNDWVLGRGGKSPNLDLKRFLQSTSFMSFPEELTSASLASFQLEELRPNIKALSSIITAGRLSKFTQVAIGENTPSYKTTELPTRGRALEQPRRGNITFGTEQTIIRLYQSADLSTFLHEAGHLFLEMEKNDVLANNGEMDDDQVAILKYLGVDRFEDIGRREHELWARSFEQYLYEGKSPNQKMRDAFGHYANWMKGVYKGMRVADAPINDEIRGVMDRMLASEKEIEMAQLDESNAELFRSQEQAGMTDKEWEAYQKQRDRAKNKSEQSLAQKLLKELKRETEQWWRQGVADYMAEHKERLKELPIYQATSHFRSQDGDKINTESVKEANGGKIPPQMLSMVSADSQITLEEASQMFGFESAQEFNEKVKTTPTMNKVAKELAEENMKQEHGDILNDGTLENLAEETSKNEEKAKVIIAEFRLLRRKLKKKEDINRADLAYRAKTLIRNTSTKNIRPHKYRMAELRNAKKAQKAFDNGDLEGALEAKRAQLANHYLYKEALEAKRKAQTIRRRLSSMKRKKWDAKKVDRDHIGRLVMMLEAYDLSSSQKGKSLEELRSIAQWIQDQQDGNDDRDQDLYLLDPKLQEILDASENGTLDQVELHSPKDMTLDELEAVDQMAQHLAFVGRRMSEEYRANQEKKYNRVADSITKVAQRGASPYGKGGMKRFLKDYSANILFHITSIVKRLDGFQDFGEVHKAIIRPIQKAVTQKLVPKQKRARDAISELYDKFYSKKELRSYSKTKVYHEGYNRDLNMWEIISLAMNMGTDSNREAVLGQKIGNREVFPNGQADVDKLLGRLSEKDWQFVQAVWDHLGTYWQETANVHQRRTGVAPKRVDAVPYKTPYGTIKGGYYPLAGDPNLSIKGDQHQEQDYIKQTSRISRAEVPAGMTIERVGFGGKPLRLGMEVWHNHINKSVHYQSMAEAVDQVQGVIKSKAVGNSIIETDNQPLHKAMDMWLKDTASGELGIEGFDKWFRWVRTGFSTMTLGWNVGTMLLQPSGIFQSVPSIGSGWAFHGVKKLFGGGFKQATRNIATVNRMSNFMAERGTQWHKDAYDTIEQVSNNPDDPSLIPKEVTESFFAGIIWFQQFVDHAVWMGAYDKSQAEHPTRTMEEHVEFADQVVRTTQASGTFSDRTAIERGTLGERTRQSELVRMWTGLGSYFFAKANLIANTYAEADLKSVKGIARFANTMMFYLAYEALLVGLLKGTFGGDDDESFIEWWATEAGKTLAGGFPLVREVSSMVEGYQGGTTLSSFQGAIANLVKQTKQGEIDTAFMRSLSDVLGIGFRLPTKATFRFTNEMYKDANGDDFNILEYFTYVKKEEQKRKDRKRKRRQRKRKRD